VDKITLNNGNNGTENIEKEAQSRVQSTQLSVTCQWHQTWTDDGETSCKHRALEYRYDSLAPHDATLTLRACAVANSRSVTQSLVTNYTMSVCITVVEKKFLTSIKPPSRTLC